ncbi:PH domain-containing protein [Candidatus Gracilibacteria bacterium]|nr:MAG: PH domain-containing protein [Candidatus Gracilibacteria bacterium]
MLNLQNMRPGEEVLMVVKRHWIVYVMLFIYFFSGVIVTFMIFFFFGLNTWGYMLNIILWLILSIILYIEWLNHELDMYVVTNNRVIGLEQIAFLNRAVTECNLGQIQEVNSKAKGLFANIFNYGTLSIQTAGSKTTLKMEFCPDVMQTSRKILNVVDNYRDEKNLKENPEY